MLMVKLYSYSRYRLSCEYTLPSLAERGREESLFYTLFIQSHYVIKLGWSAMLYELIGEAKTFDFGLIAVVRHPFQYSCT